jgi:hypothetical protein
MGLGPAGEGWDTTVLDFRQQYAESSRRTQRTQSRNTILLRKEERYTTVTKNNLLVARFICLESHVL